MISNNRITIRKYMFKVEDFITLTVVPLDGVALTEAMHSRFVEVVTFPYCSGVVLKFRLSRSSSFLGV